MSYSTGSSAVSSLESMVFTGGGRIMIEVVSAGTVGPVTTKMLGR